MEPFVTYKDPYLGIYTKSYLWTTEHYNVFIDAGLASGTERKLPALHNGRENVLLLTHGHWDHVGCNAITQRLGGKVLAHAGDKKHLEDYSWHWEGLFGQFAQDFDLPPARKTTFWDSVAEPVTPDRLVEDGEVLAFDELRFRVIAIPGHSPGSVCYLEEGSGILFSGDGIMGNGFFTGTPQIADYEAYISSMERLKALHITQVITDHTDPVPGGELVSLLETSQACAKRLFQSVERYAAETEGPLTVGGAARAIAEAEGKGVGGGTCVSALAALRQLNDPRAQACAAKYICGV